MPQQRNLAIESLREALEYSPRTGQFLWRFRASARPTWNSKFAGKTAGYTNPNGYVYISLDGCRYLAHRLAWLYVTGKWPREEIDHRNGKRSDNRFKNLREASVTQNRQNGRKRANATSRFKGVYWHAARNRWQASINKDGKTLYLGVFKTEEAAGKAYWKAAREIFGEFARFA